MEVQILFEAKEAHLGAMEDHPGDMEVKLRDSVKSHRVFSLSIES